MEKYISLILLAIAGIILLFLFIYSFRTRVDNYKHQSPKLGKTDKLFDDEADALTMPFDEIIEVRDAKPNEFNKRIEPAPRRTYTTQPRQIRENTITTIDADDIPVIRLTPINKDAAKEFIPAPILKSAIKPIVKEPENHVNPILKQPTAVTTSAPTLASTPASGQASIKTELENFKPLSLLTLHVLPAEGERFVGFDLLQAMLGANLYFGKMSIFHLHTQPMGKGKILFSAAQANEPGVFNMNAISSWQCSGLALFMQLTDPEHNLETLEQFFQTAQQLAENLGGMVVFQKRSNPLTLEIKKQFAASVQHHLTNLKVRV